LISISADRLIDRKDGLRDDECRRALKSTCLLVRACLKRTVREGPKTNALWHEFIHPHHVSPPVLLVVIRMNSYIRIILSFSYATVLPPHHVSPPHTCASSSSCLPARPSRRYPHEFIHPHHSFVLLCDGASTTTERQKEQ
jgi:hypothetical protein